VKTQELQDAINSAIPRKRESRHAVRGDVNRSPAQHPRLRILVADDSPVNLEVAAGVLQLQGHQVALAESGRVALEHWRREHFDIILMDLEMHDLDGLAATASIRQEEAVLPDRGRTPIIAVTAHVAEGVYKRCLAAGMDGCVSKPFQPQELFRIIASCCGKTHRAAASSMPFAGTASE